MSRLWASLNLRIGYGLIDWKGLRHLWRAQRTIRGVFHIGKGKFAFFLTLKASWEQASWVPSLRWRSVNCPLSDRMRILTFSFARLTAEAIHFARY